MHLLEPWCFPTVLECVIVENHEKQDKFEMRFVVFSQKSWQYTDNKIKGSVEKHYRLRGECSGNPATVFRKKLLQFVDNKENISVESHYRLKPEDRKIVNLKLWRLQRKSTSVYFARSHGN